jgi:hypothetical protein
VVAKDDTKIWLKVEGKEVVLFIINNKAFPNLFYCISVGDKKIQLSKDSSKSSPR